MRAYGGEEEDDVVGQGAGADGALHDAVQSAGSG